MKTPSTALEPRAHGTAWSILLVIICTSAVILGNGSLTMVSIALPLIAEDLNIPQARLQWIITAYSLASGCFFLLFGRVADLYGRKRVFLLCQLWFAVFSLAGGFAKSDIALDVLRALTGMAPAATIPAGLGILAQTFPPSRARSLAFACFAAGAPLGGVLGWVIAAPLVQYTAPSWRTPFYLMSALGLVVACAAFVVVERDPPVSTEGKDGEPTDRTIDWLGALLVTSGLVLLTFALAQGEVVGWRTPYIIALLVLAPLLLVVFGFWEIHYEHKMKRAPLLRMALFTRGHGTFSVVMLIALVEFCSFHSWIYWTTLFYQQLHRKSPMLVMVRFLPMPVVGLALNVLVGFFAAHIPLVHLVVVGTCATGIASLLFAIIDTSASYWTYNFFAACLSVFGADLVFAPGSIFVARVALPHEQSVAGGLFQTLVQLGAAFGIATTTIVHDAGVRRAVGGQETFGDDVASAPYDAQLKGYRQGFWMSFAFAMAGMVLGAVFLRKVGVVGDKGPKKTVDVEEQRMEKVEEPSRQSQEGSEAPPAEKSSHRSSTTAQ